MKDWYIDKESGYGLAVRNPNKTYHDGIRSGEQDSWVASNLTPEYAKRIVAIPKMEEKLQAQAALIRKLGEALSESVDSNENGPALSAYNEWLKENTE